MGKNNDRTGNPKRQRDQGKLRMREEALARAMELQKKAAQEEAARLVGKGSYKERKQIKRMFDGGDNQGRKTK